MLLPWPGGKVIGRCVCLWSWLKTAQLTVVCDACNRGVLAELDRLGLSPANRIVNPQPETGMFGSIQCAARWSGWSSDLTHWVVALGDQPHLREESLRSLLSAVPEAPDCVWQPAFRGHARHPVVLPFAVFRELANAESATFKEFLETRSNLRRQIEMDDPGLDLDLDTPEDYEKALRLVATIA